MKKLLLMVAAAILGFTACDNGGGEIIFGSITIKDKAQLDQEVGAAGDIVNVDFESEMQWSASVTEGAGWMSLVSPSSGEAGEFSLEIEVGANNTASAREGSVSIVCGDDRVAIKIRQFSEDGDSGDDVNTPGEALPVRMVSWIDYNGTKVGFDYDYEGRIKRMEVINDEYDEHIGYDLTYGDGTITLSFETEWEGSTPSYPGTEGTVIGGRNVVEYVATLNSDGMVASYEGSSIFYIDSDGSGDIYDSSFAKGEMEYANGRLVKITGTDDNGNESVYDFQWGGKNISKVSYTLRGEGLSPVDLYSEITAGELLNDPKMSVDINYLLADDEVLSSVFGECPFVIMGLCGERSAHLMSSIRTYDSDGTFMYESLYTYEVDGRDFVVGGSVSGNEFNIEYL